MAAVLLGAAICIYLMWGIVDGWTVKAAPIPQCNGHDAMKATLLKEAGENPIIVGVSHTRLMMEMYVSENGRWTLVNTETLGGLSCIVDYGRGLTILKVPPKERGIRW